MIIQSIGHLVQDVSPATFILITNNVSSEIVSQMWIFLAFLSNLIENYIFYILFTKKTYVMMMLSWALGNLVIHVFH